MTLVLGVGNRMMGDDAFGPLVVEKLRESGAKAELWFGEAPENFIGKFPKNPDILVILDTALLGRKPGSVKHIDPDRVISQPSTHKFPLPLVMETLNPGKTYFIGAEPKSLGFGDEPSPEILKAVEKAFKMVKKLLV